MSIQEGEPACHERWGIENAFAEDLDETLLRSIARTCRRAYRALEMSGYGRIDLRLTEDGRLIVVEANPNPAIARDEDFAESAARAGVPYDELIPRILRQAFDRRR